MTLKDYLNTRKNKSGKGYRLSEYINEYYGMKFDGKIMIRAVSPPHIAGMLVMFEDCTCKVYSYSEFKNVIQPPTFEESVEWLKQFLKTITTSHPVELPPYIAQSTYVVLKGLNEGRKIKW